MLRSFLTLVLFLTIFISCKKDVKIINPNKSLTPFTVSVVSRGANKAVISWTEAMNIYNSDSVKYYIALGGKLVRTNFAETLDTLINLVPDSIYNGVVYAKTKNGDTSSATFLLENVDGCIIFGDNFGTLNCINIYSGIPLWRTAGSAGAYDYISMPTVVDNVIYTNTSSAGTMALSLKTGDIIWNNRFSPGEYGHFNPIYHDGKIFTIYGPGIHSLDAKTGKVIWTYSEGGNRYYTNPVVGNDLLFEFMIGEKFKIIAIDINTGKKVWEYITNDGISENPVLYKDLIIFGANDRGIYALKQKTGEKVWTRYFINGSTTMISPRIFDNKVIVHGAGDGFFCLWAENGNTVWNNTESQGVEISSPAIGDGRIYFFMSNYPMGIVVAIDLRTGVTVWKQKVNISSVSTPIFAKGRLYFGRNYYWGIPVLDAETGLSLGSLAGHLQQTGDVTIVVNDSAFYLPQSGMVQ